MVALAHGTNDAQKTMGVITLTLITAGLLPAGAAPPFWVILSAGLAIASGTYIGGWRIIQTLGKRRQRDPDPAGLRRRDRRRRGHPHLAHLGFALSTTQVATGAIFGAGAGRRAGHRAVGVAGRMALAWLLTLPAAAVVGAVAAWAASTGHGRHGRRRARAGRRLAAGIYAASRRQPVDRRQRQRRARAAPSPSPPRPVSGGPRNDQLG